MRLMEDGFLVPSRVGLKPIHGELVGPVFLVTPGFEF